MFIGSVVVRKNNSLFSNLFGIREGSIGVICALDKGGYFRVYFSKSNPYICCSEDDLLEFNGNEEDIPEEVRVRRDQIKGDPSLNTNENLVRLQVADRMSMIANKMKHSACKSDVKNNSFVIKISTPKGPLYHQFDSLYYNLFDIPVVDGLPDNVFYDELSVIKLLTII